MALAAVHVETVTRPGPKTETGTANGSQRGASSSSWSSAYPTIHVLIADQFQRLLSLIDRPQPGYEKFSGKIPWMLDSRASCHMVGDASMLTDMKKIALMELASLGEN